MLTDLVSKMAAGTDLRPTFQNLMVAWENLPVAQRRRHGGPVPFVHGRWTGRESRAFAWQQHRDLLAETSQPFTAQLLYRLPGEPALRSWELVGFTASLRHQLATNLRTIESLAESERPLDLRVLHREIVTAFRIEDLGLRQQAAQITEFLGALNAPVLQIRGLTGPDAAARFAPFRAQTEDDDRGRLRHIMGRLFAVTPQILTHPSSDPVRALRETGADSLVTFDPGRPTPFELEPVLKAECELYLNAGVLDLEVDDLRRTVLAFADVLTEKFGAELKALERASA